jgi:hypothetical protein
MPISPSAAMRGKTVLITGLVLGDLLSQADIRGVATDISDRYDRLDVIINNAGAVFKSMPENSTGTTCRARRATSSSRLTRRLRPRTSCSPTNSPASPERRRHFRRL